MKNDLILTLYQKSQTVFSIKEISLLFPGLDYINLKNRLSYYVRTGSLKRIRKGIFAKKDFNVFELANKLYTPSYISLETVLEKTGIIFQSYKDIFAVSYLTRKVRIGETRVFYRHLKEKILFNNAGISEKENYFIASKERAFLDAVFLYKNYYFDNLKPLDWGKIFELKKIYQSQALEKRIEEYYQLSKKENV